PATLGVTGRYSNQLNYRTNFLVFFSIFFRACLVFKGVANIDVLFFFANSMTKKNLKKIHTEFCK
ncbi:MAG TPA: hypothetical protein PLS94_00820, partial [Prolixibacteraceae bacterium]|nr:hypothetical protein [Prolixibacteraceae bacterium]